MTWVEHCETFTKPVKMFLKILEEDTDPIDRRDPDNQNDYDPDPDNQNDQEPDPDNQNDQNSETDNQNDQDPEAR